MKLYGIYWLVLIDIL